MKAQELYNQANRWYHESLKHKQEAERNPAYADALNKQASIALNIGKEFEQKAILLK